MPGRLRTNFRSGNLAEHLGLLLLKGVAAVADVPRSEDVGIDAIATLLRPDPDGNCYAEDSFVVQLKSDSETTIKYESQQLPWLLSQSQPMLIGLVSRKEARISLYPTLYAHQAAFALHANQMTLRFQKSDGPYPWAGGSAESVAVFLGPPLISWTLTDMDDPAWKASAYETLKRFLEIARRELYLLSLGQISKIMWDTDGKGSIRSVPDMMKVHPGGFEARARDCMPNLKALMLHAFAMPTDQGHPLIVCLLGVVASLRRLGVEIDPHISGFFEKVHNVQIVITDKNGSDA